MAPDLPALSLPALVEHMLDTLELVRSAAAESVSLTAGQRAEAAWETLRVRAPLYKLAALLNERGAVKLAEENPMEAAVHECL